MTVVLDHFAEALALTDLADAAAWLGLRPLAIACGPAAAPVIGLLDQLAGVPPNERLAARAQLESLARDLARPERIVDAQALEEFVARRGRIGDELVTLVLERERDQGCTACAQVRRLIHTLKGEAGVLGLDGLSAVCHAFEDAIAAGADLGADVLLPAAEWIGDEVRRLSGGPGPEHSADEQTGRLARRRPPLGEVLATHGLATPAAVADALACQRSAAGPPSRLGDLMVAQGVLSPAVRDRALALQERGRVRQVGVDADVLAEAEDLCASMSAQANAPAGLDTLLRLLRRLRRTELSAVGARLARGAEALGRRLRKPVAVTVQGAVITVERVVADRLEEALLHLLRNAIDHGIEEPAARQALGKPLPALLNLDFSVRGGRLLAAVTDDGHGLDRAAILARARSRDLLPAGAEPDDAGLAGLILLPGFSTAASTTEVSGRGVGMDAAARAARDLGGSLTIANRPGQGLTVTLDIPLEGIPP